MQSTADLCDLHVASPSPLAVVSACYLKSYGGRSSFSGAVVTCRCFESNPIVREVLSTPGHGRVLVVDGGGSTRCALLGDQIGQLAVDNGWGGVVINGCIRDVSILRTLPLGVLAIGSIPVKSLKTNPGITQVPVSFGGVEFVPGCLLYADDDGVVLLPAPAATSPPKATSPLPPPAPPPHFSSSSSFPVVKYIFLDVDGVVASGRCICLNVDPSTDATLLSPSPSLLGVCLERSLLSNLAWLVAQCPGTKVVVSSTWRLDDGLFKFLREALREAGIGDESFAGSTPNLEGRGRGAEIRAFLDANRHDGYVILDDEHMDSFRQSGVEDHVVVTKLDKSMASELREDEGLNKERAAEAELVLSRP